MTDDARLSWFDLVQLSTADHVSRAGAVLFACARLDSQLVEAIDDELDDFASRIHRAHDLHLLTNAHDLHRARELRNSFAHNAQTPSALDAATALSALWTASSRLAERETSSIASALADVHAGILELAPELAKGRAFTGAEGITVALLAANTRAAYQRAASLTLAAALADIALTRLEYEHDMLDARRAQRIDRYKVAFARRWMGTRDWESVRSALAERARCAHDEWAPNCQRTSDCVELFLALASTFASHCAQFEKEREERARTEQRERQAAQLAFAIEYHSLSARMGRALSDRAVRTAKELCWTALWVIALVTLVLAVRDVYPTSTSEYQLLLGRTSTTHACSAASPCDYSAVSFSVGGWLAFVLQFVLLIVLSLLMAAVFWIVSAALAGFLTFCACLPIGALLAFWDIGVAGPYGSSDVRQLPRPAAVLIALAIGSAASSLAAAHFPESLRLFRTASPPVAVDPSVGSGSGQRTDAQPRPAALSRPDSVAMAPLRAAAAAAGEWPSAPNAFSARRFERSIIRSAPDGAPLTDPRVKAGLLPHTSIFATERKGAWIHVRAQIDDEVFEGWMHQALLTFRAQLAEADAGFVDQSHGRDWNRRCEAHVHSLSLGAAKAACRRAFAAQPDTQTASRTYELLAAVARAEENWNEAVGYLCLARAGSVQPTRIDADVARLKGSPDGGFTCAEWDAGVASEDGE